MVTGRHELNSPCWCFNLLLKFSRSDLMWIWDSYLLTTFFLPSEFHFMVNLLARMLLWLSDLLKQVARMYPRLHLFFRSSLIKSCSCCNITLLFYCCSWLHFYECFLIEKKILCEKYVYLPDILHVFREKNTERTIKDKFFLFKLHDLWLKLVS